MVRTITKFFAEDIWEVGRDGASRLQRVAYAAIRVAYIAIEGFFRDMCTTRASALTFATLMGLVPVLALSFAVLRGLGWHGDRLEGLILNRVTILSPEAINLVVSYIDNINFAGLGVFGAAFLFVTFLSVVTNVEISFNAIWGHVRARTVGRRFIDYFGVMAVAPLLLIVATSLTAAVQSNTVVQWVTGLWGLGLAVEYSMAYAAYAVVWMLFAFLYMFVPNTRVRFLPAVIGGVIAGSVWQLTQWGYIQFQIGMGRYNAIYGALAQLPLLMAWVYASWVIVLFGAEIAYAVQTVTSYSRERRAANMSRQAFRDWVAMSVAVELARAAKGKTDAPSAEILSQLLDVPSRTVLEVLADFERAGLAHVGADNGQCCYLSLSPDRISVASVLDATHGALPSANEVGVEVAVARRQAHAILREICEARDRGFGSLSLADVIAASSDSEATAGGRALSEARQGPRPAASDIAQARRDLRKGGA